jgi:branched-chain amino acid transport system substrate-binding protein
MKQAANLNDFQPPLGLPGIKFNTSATDFTPVESLQFVRFNGKHWTLFGDVMSR